MNDDGLERWEPVMKAAFPLSTDVAAPAFAADAHPLDRFLSELVEPEGLARAVRVYKRRVRYTVGGCIAELSAVQADGTQLRTVAIESEDAAAVIAAVREVGLGGWANTSYQKALGRMVDRAPERFAAIDVGTNSVKFHVAERQADDTWTTVADRAEVCRLGEGIQETGALAPAAMDRTVEAIAGMADEAAGSARRGSPPWAPWAADGLATARRSSTGSGSGAG